MLAVCLNDSFRRIFGYKRYESVKVLQLYCGHSGELPFDLMYNLIKWKFLITFSDVPVRFMSFMSLINIKVTTTF